MRLLRLVFLTFVSSTIATSVNAERIDFCCVQQAMETLTAGHIQLGPKLSFYTPPAADDGSQVWFKDGVYTYIYEVYTPHGVGPSRVYMAESPYWDFVEVAGNWNESIQWGSFDGRGLALLFDETSARYTAEPTGMEGVDEAHLFYVRSTLPPMIQTALVQLRVPAFCGGYMEEPPDVCHPEYIEQRTGIMYAPAPEPTTMLLVAAGVASILRRHHRARLRKNLP